MNWLKWLVGLFLLSTLVGCAAGAKDAYVRLGKVEQPVAEIKFDEIGLTAGVRDGVNFYTVGERWTFNVMAARHWLSELDVLGLFKPKTEVPAPEPSPGG